MKRRLPCVRLPALVRFPPLCELPLGRRSSRPFCHSRISRPTLPRSVPLRWPCRQPGTAALVVRIRFAVS